MELLAGHDPEGRVGRPRQPPPRRDRVDGADRDAGDRQPDPRTASRRPPAPRRPATSPRDRGDRAHDDRRARRARGAPAPRGPGSGSARGPRAARRRWRVISTSPMRLSAYARPGLRSPSRARCPAVAAASAGARRGPARPRSRKATLAASWTARSVSGGTSATACLLTTVPPAQQAAARIRKARFRYRRSGVSSGHSALTRKARAVRGPVCLDRFSSHTGSSDRSRSRTQPWSSPPSVMRAWWRG